LKRKRYILFADPSWKARLESHQCRALVLAERDVYSPQW
jgi:hypothetical protein